VVDVCEVDVLFVIDCFYLVVVIGVECVVVGLFVLFGCLFCFCCLDLCCVDCDLVWVYVVV